MVAIPISLSRNKPYTPQGGTQPLCVCVCVCVCVLQRPGEDQDLRMMIFTLTCLLPAPQGLMGSRKDVSGDPRQRVRV